MPKDMGGLGVLGVRDFNRALLSKWLWKLVPDIDGCWFRTVEKILQEKKT